VLVNVLAFLSIDPVLIKLINISVHSDRTKEVFYAYCLLPSSPFSIVQDKRKITTVFDFLKVSESQLGGQ
jgi:hypothetical protein